MRETHFNINNRDIRHQVERNERNQQIYKEWRNIALLTTWKDDQFA